MPISEAAAETLLEALLAGGDEDRLDPIRGEPGVRITWLAVNEARVDATVSSESGREWRVVFAAADGSAVDWLAVHERPPAYEGVAGGRAVVVNGPSGAGKSVLMAGLAAASSSPWVVFDEPTFGAVDPSLLIWRERAEPLHRGFLAGIAAVAREGNQVAVAAAGHPQVAFRRTLAGVPTLYIGLRCSLATLEKRERGREGRWGGLAASSVDAHEGWTYDLELDTTSTAAPDLAAQVLDAVERLGAPG